MKQEIEMEGYTVHSTLGKDMVSRRCFHKEHAVFVIVIKGKLQVEADNKTCTLTHNSAPYTIPAMKRYQFKAIEDCVFLHIFRGRIAKGDEYYH